MRCAIALAVSILLCSNLAFASDTNTSQVTAGPPRPVFGPIGATGDGPIARPVPAGPHSSDEFYPVESRKLREEGDVLVAFIVHKDGTVSDVQVIRSSGYPRLDVAAVAAVTSWRYQPAMQGSKPIEFRLEAKLEFRMREPQVPMALYTVIEAPTDAYPADALASGQEGSATVEVVINDRGGSMGATLVESSGILSLDNASILLVSNRLHFTPPTADGRPLKAYAIIVVHWAIPARVPVKPEDHPRPTPDHPV